MPINAPITPKQQYYVVRYIQVTKGTTYTPWHTFLYKCLYDRYKYFKAILGLDAQVVPYTIWQSGQ